MNLLKFGLTWIILLMFSGIGISQFSKENALYFEGGYITGNYQGISARLNYARNYSFSCHLSYSYSEIDSPTIPPGFEGGSTTWFSPVKDFRKTVSVGTGYIIGLNEKKSVRFHPKLGVSFYSTRIAHNWKENTQQFFYDPNYTYEYHYATSLGLTLNTPVDIAFSRNVGIYVNPRFLFIKNDFEVNFEIGLMFGLIRHEKMNLKNSN